MEYFLTPEQLAPAGKSVLCSSCGHTFTLDVVHEIPSSVPLEVARDTLLGGLGIVEKGCIGCIAIPLFIMALVVAGIECDKIRCENYDLYEECNLKYMPDGCWERYCE
jgi:predicted Zn finger-like uncharacterized protein